MDQRSDNHSKVPIMRSQIRALRYAARSANSAVAESETYERAGEMLAAGMNAGFALELGLKLFYMSYHHRAVRGHDLHKLFAGLPDQIQGDISLSYSTSLEASILPPTIKFMAFRNSTTPPAKPDRAPKFDPTTAQGLFDFARGAFEGGRYFYDKVNADDWTNAGYPIDHMLLMSEILDVVYDEYIRRGGWD